MGFLLLSFSIATEVFGSTMLKLSQGFKRKLPIVGLVAGYAASFYFLSLALVNVPLSLAYAIWSGVGTALTAIVGVYVFRERISPAGVFGIVLLLFGAALLNL